MDAMSDFPSFFRKLMVHCVGPIVIDAHQSVPSAAGPSSLCGYVCTNLIRCLTTDVGVCILMKK